ncbi:hypothetical protein [Bacillus alveayuensis]|uniref:hypothetical protein n=1 Tax=Aeribacillus alveayuensis TaxID=279215 RepID=UPI000B1DA157|nr:hypothetical protein [Bacillus alveayuensis]
MNGSYDLASLTNEQKEKIKQLERELNVVLIAWKPYQQEFMSEKEYDDLLEDDRL